MNKITLVRFSVALCCGHQILYDIPPKVRSIVICKQCQGTAGSVVKYVEKVHPNGLSSEGVGLTM